jgi:hypothetical protein
MKSILTISICLLCATSSFAGNAARVDGDLSVKGTMYLSDNSPLTSSYDLLRNKGNFVLGTQYSAGDVVQSGGSSYVCITANQGQPLLNTSYWSALAKQGLQGVQGLKGDTGPPGTANSLIGSIHGTVDVGGTIINGSGFTVSRTSKGNYTVNFNTNFPQRPDCTLSAIGQYNYGDGPTICSLSSVYVTSFNVVLPTTSSFNVTCYQYMLGQTPYVYYIYDLKDSPFTFICVSQ